MPAPTLQDLAPAGLDVTTDPYPVYAALRAKGPVHRVLVPGSGEAWLVVARDEARAALTDPRLSNDIRYSSSWADDGGHAIGVNMLQSDAPRHTRLRGLVAREFTAGRIRALRPRIREIADSLLGALPAAAGSVDLVASYALPLPMTVICELLGVPETDRDGFHAWSTELVAPSSAEAAGAAVGAMTDRLTALIEERRSDPRGDLLSALVSAPADGLSAEELLGMAFLLLVAGHETTVNLVSATVLALLGHPEQFAAVRADPGLVDAAIEETLRYDGPVESTAFRFATEPVRIGDTTVPAGDSVLVSLAAASRDPRHFPDPDRFDLHRAPAGHLAFGHGIHHCLGAPLARVEAAIALRALIERHPGLALDADPADLVWRPSTMLRGLTRLPVRLRG